MNHLSLFAKYWEPGQVKTRLAESRHVGPVRAADVHRHFVAALTTRFAAVGDFREICVWPPERQSEFRDVAGHRWDTTAQHGADLGERMQNQLRRAVRRDGNITAVDGDMAAVLIGSDSPNLPKELLAEAFDRLRDRDLVIGPSEDGGYYLIGVRNVVPAVFDNVHWGSSDVLAETTALADQAGLDWQLLPTWYDVDRIADLERLYADLRQQAEPELQELHQEIATLVNLTSVSDNRDSR